MRRLAELAAGVLFVFGLYEWAFGSNAVAIGCAAGFVALGIIAARLPAAPTARTPAAPAPPRGLFDVLLRYRDGNDVPSERRVTALRIERMDGVLHPGRLALTGWCHERKAERSFRLDRIVDAIDPDTGEVAQDPARWILARAGSTEQPDPPPPPRRIRIAPDPERPVRILFKGRRRGTRWAQGVVHAIRVAEGRPDRATFLIQGDPTGAEDDFRELTLAPPGRSGVLLSLVPFGETEPVPDIARWLDQLPRTPRG